MDVRTLTPHGQPTTIVGRDRERAQLDFAIGDGSDGLRFVLLTGPSGYGKTTLLADALERAEERGFQLAVGVGRSAALTPPLTPWLEALPQLVGFIEANIGPLDIDTLGVEMVRAVCEAASGQPLLLAFDDVQALDESSLALLPYLQGLDDDVSVTCVFVEQSDAPTIPASYSAFREALTTNLVVNSIELGPMSDEAVIELARVTLGGDETAEVPPEVVLRAEGNPWFALELLTAFKSGGNEVPATIAAAALHRLGTLGEDVADLALAVAVSEDGIGSDWLRMYAEVDDEGFALVLQELFASGLVRDRDGQLSIVHPLMQRALVDELSAAMRRAIHAELATAIATFGDFDGIVVRARGVHLGLAGKIDDAIASLCLAAAIHQRNGQAHEALSDYLRALELEPRIGNRAGLLKLCAFTALQAGSDTAPDLWAELGRLALAVQDQGLLAYALYQEYMSRDSSRPDLVKRAAEIGDREYGWSARAAASLANLAGDLETATEYGEVSLELARAAGDVELETLNLDKLASAYGQLAAFEKAIDASRQAIELATKHHFHGWVVSSSANLSEALVDTLETEQSLIECERTIAYIESFGLTSYRPFALAMRGIALVRCGRLEEALVSIEEARTSQGFHPSRFFSVLIAEIRANILAEIGDVARATPAVDAALLAADEYGAAAFIFEAKLDQAMVLAARGSTADALEIAASLSIGEPSAMARLALWTARLGAIARVNGAGSVASSMVAQVERSDVPLSSLMLREVDAILAGNIPELEACELAWRQSGRPLDELRTRLVIGMLHSTEGRTIDAVTSLKAAHAGLSTIGAIRDSDLAAEELRKHGARGKAFTKSSEIGVLTDRELQIVRLVASGMRNAEVADQLRVANKTVAAHLSKIYGKLNVNSRGQLTAWARRNDVAS